MRRMPVAVPVFVSSKAAFAAKLAVIAPPTLLIAIMSYRGGLLAAPEFFAALVVAFLIAAIALLIAVLAWIELWRRGGRGAGKASWAAFLACLTLSPAVAAVALSWANPAVNDVTTRPASPPAFRAVEAERLASGAATDYRGEAAPPASIVPAILDVTPNLAFDMARTLAEEKGWTIHEAMPPGEGQPGRIEATARTLVFGFPDDVVLEISSGEQGTLVDMRSASRIGEHDLGQNARRIRGFLADLATAIDQRPPPEPM